MTDKKKLDEAVTLTMNSDQGEIQMNSSVSAESLPELVALLKNSGIVADDFNGPASLSSDEGGFSTNVSAPNLRSIMNMLEPVFQMVGDMEADMMEPAVCDQAIAEPETDMVAIEPEVEMEPEMGAEIYDPGCGPDDFSPDKEYAEPEMEPEFAEVGAPDTELEMDIEEDAEYDYRTHDVHPHEYEAPASKEIVQPKTHDVPARSSDNPLDENSGGGAVGVKTFMDYVKEAELNELGANTIKSYVKKVNDHGDEDMDDETARKRGRGLSNAQNKIHWKDAKVLATENTFEGLMGQLGDYLGEDLSIKKMGNHVIVLSDPADDEIEDLESDTPAELDKVVKDISADMHEDGEMRPMPPRPSDYNSVAKRAREESKGGYVQHVDRHEDGGHSVSDWMSDNTVGSFANGRHVGGQDIEEEAEGGSLTVTVPAGTDLEEIMDAIDNLTGMSCDDSDGESVAVWDDGTPEMVELIKQHFPNVQVELTSQVDEEQLDEISDATKDSYFSKAAKQADHHARLMSMHDELGNQDMVDKHHAHIKKRVAGMQASVKGFKRPGAQVTDEAEEPKTRFDIQGTVCDYQIIDTQTGEVVATDIRSGTMAHEMCIWYEKEAKNAETTPSEVDEATRGSAQWRRELDRKNEQYGTPFFLNTDCGYASLEDIVKGHDYFDGHGGITVLEIDRNGKTGLNFLSGVDADAPAGTKVTCITQTSTGQKFRPGKVVASVTSEELVNDYDGVVKKLAAYGITPTKKLSVKTFD